jgi:hypothetical protein
MPDFFQRPSCRREGNDPSRDRRHDVRVFDFDPLLGATAGRGPVSVLSPAEKSGGARPIRRACHPLVGRFLHLTGAQVVTGRREEWRRIGLAKAMPAGCGLHAWRCAVSHSIE